MRLKKIEVLGFKSFADRQVVHVDDHVTGVIGPNGCGKSNIVDAIRWAMGEQSAKHLRGAGMADVIFAGCSSRGPAGVAEVTLTFFNQGDAPPPWGDVAEIALTRRLFADGTSEYLINKVPARLRDISDLLAGTGVGTKGYSIIEQGQVGKIVSSKPEDRRSIIDEAAGITRFKAQKAAAARKIEATRQNLLRVRDVVAELDDRLGTLRRQAQKAERYKKYRGELRDLELWQAAQRLLELHAMRNVLEARRGHLGQQIDDVRASLSARDAQIAALRVQITVVEQDLTERQQKVYDLDNRVRLAEAEDDYRRREREAALQSASSARAEAEVAGRAAAHVQSELSELEQERSALGDGTGESGEQEQLVRLSDRHARTDAELWTERSRQESGARELGERRSGLAATRARAEALAETAAVLQERGTALREALAHTETTRDELAAAAARLASERAELERVLAGLREHRGGLERQRIELRERIASAEVELDTGRAELHRARSRLQSLEEIQARYRGCASGVQVVMEHRAELEAHADGSVGGGRAHAAVLGIVADHIEVPEHLESALSAVLGERLEGVVVEATDDAARGVALLKRAQEGRLSFLPRDCRAPGPPTVHAEGTALGWRDPSIPVARGIELVDISGEPSRPTLVEIAGPDGVAEAAMRAVVPAVELSAEEQELADLERELAALDEPPAVDAPPTDDARALVVDAAAPAPATPEAAAPALPAEPGILGRLVDLVRCGSALGELPRVLLGDTVVVDGLSRALELWQTRRIAAPMVTLDGDRIDPSGVIVGGSPTALNAALLQQKREIRELQAIVASLQEAFEITRGRHLALAEAAAEIERARESADAALTDSQSRAAAIDAEHHAVGGELVRVGQLFGARTVELATLDRDLDARAAEASSLERTSAEVGERIAELEQDLARGDERIAALATERDALAADLTEAKVALARWQQKSDALAGTAARLVRQLDGEQIRLARLDETATAATAKAEALAAALAESAGVREQLVEDSRLATARVHDTRERHDALRLELDEIEASLRTLRNELDEHRERMQEVELGLRENELERGHLDRDVRERLDIDLREVLIDFHDRRLFEALEHERALELKRVIARMGEVNLTAIDEFEEVSTRYEYLVRQRDDLENAVTQLQEAIDRIDKTTRQMFKDTFTAVNERFQQIFPRLFAGGRAELVLTDPDDMLGTGVEIVAQPPGKQLRSLDLLSGGEKALTAVSLIFAIFLIKPSPFCLLDEVDAPLDDVNVGRFCGLVRELAATTQFIIITHNKVSMETADRLYGVTMEQRGVSKLVSVNIRRAVELAYN